MPGRAANVRYWGQIGLNADIGIRAGFDPYDVVMQPLLGGLNPRPEPVALPSGQFHFYKNDPCRLHEQDAQVAIAPLRYFAEDRAVPGRDLPRNQP